MAEVFTVGVYGSDREAFFAALDAAGVDVVLDIRRRRAVRGPRYAYANARRLVDELTRRGIAYRHVLELAPDRSLLALQHAADDLAGQRKPERTALAPEYVRRYVHDVLDRFDFTALAAELRTFRASALLCVERIPSACHRHLVAPRLAAALGAPATIHLIPEPVDL